MTAAISSVACRRADIVVFKVTKGAEAWAMSSNHCQSPYIRGYTHQKATDISQNSTMYITFYTWKCLWTMHASNLPSKNLFFPSQFCTKVHVQGGYVLTWTDIVIITVSFLSKIQLRTIRWVISLQPKSFLKLPRESVLLYSFWEAIGHSYHFILPPSAHTHMSLLGSSPASVKGHTSWRSWLLQEHIPPTYCSA